MSETRIPTYDALMNPVVQALKSLGGSGTIEEVNSKSTEILGLTDKQLELLHDEEKSSQRKGSRTIALNCEKPFVFRTENQ